MNREQTYDAHSKSVSRSRKVFDEGQKSDKNVVIVDELMEKAGTVDPSSTDKACGTRYALPPATRKRAISVNYYGMPGKLVFPRKEYAFQSNTARIPNF